MIEAGDEEMSVALGTVFILNSIALFAFPPIGHQLHLTQTQFGVWAAMRPLVFGVILWLVISGVSLLVIYSNQISIS